VSVSSHPKSRRPKTAPQPRVLFRLGPLEITRKHLIWVGVAVVIAIAFTVGGSRIGIDEIHARAQDLPGWAGFASVTLLPLVGFPLSILHVAAGVRFGIGGGIAVVAGATFIQTILAWALVLLIPRVFERRLSAWKDRIPETSHRNMIILCSLLPGLPYTVQLYLLPLIGVPLRLLLIWAVPIHTIRAIISIAGGDMSDDITVTKVVFFVVYYAVIFSACVITVRRLQGQYRAPKPA